MSREARVPSLGEVRHVLAGRAQVEKPGDPILLWIKRLSKVLMEKMGGDSVQQAEADVHYEELVDEARLQAALWREAGREDLVRRLSMLLKTRL